MSETGEALSLEVTDGEAVIGLPTDCDLRFQPELGQMIQHQMDDAEVGRVVIDLRDTHFLDASALGTIVDGLRLAKRTDPEKDFIVRNVTRENIARIFEISELVGLFKFEDSPALSKKE